MREFDVIIIGAGPAAAGALIGLEQPARLCIITGGAPAVGANSRDVHPKIRTVAAARKEAPGVADPIVIAGLTRPAFSTATAGGLGNYWGQQFVRYSAAEPWPRAIFDRYESYETACAKVEAEFRLDESNGPLGPEQSGVGAYRARSPRLLVGTTRDPQAGLLSMRRLIEQKGAEHETTTIDTRAERLVSANGRWGAKLSNGQTVFARRILLAAGVLGTAALMMRSFPEIGSVRLSDHAPFMFYTYGIGRLVRTRRRGPELHFNVQTLERDTEAGVVLFATVYNMRYAELNLLLTMLLGKAVPGMGAGLRHGRATGSSRCRSGPKPRSQRSRLERAAPLRSWTGRTSGAIRNSAPSATRSEITASEF